MKQMKWLNYNHLYYFWMVAREGSVSRAAEELLISQPTISCQLKDLERALGRKLLERVGRRLVLTEAGRVAYHYAQEIFSRGQDLLTALERQPATAPLRLTVGVLDVLPKSVVRRLLEPASQLPQPVRLICREDKAERLLADLAGHRFDVVLSDAPLGASVQMQGFNHLLADSGITFFAPKEVAARYRRGFPRSLDGAPVLLPSDNTAMRRTLDLWLDGKHIHPSVVGEFDDGTTLAAFGAVGTALFPAPSVVEAEVRRQYGVQVVGRLEQVRERFYAITVQAKLQHPAVVAICEAARRNLQEAS